MDRIALVIILRRYLRALEREIATIQEKLPDDFAETQEDAFNQLREHLGMPLSHFTYYPILSGLTDIATEMSEDVELLLGTEQDYSLKLKDYWSPGSSEKDIS